jgi:hypothetical protein
MRTRRVTLQLIGLGCLFFVNTRAAEPEAAFLRERVSVTTSYGVTGLPPGTRVTIVSRHGSRMTVKSEPAVRCLRGPAYHGRRSSARDECT